MKKSGFLLILFLMFYGKIEAKKMEGKIIFEKDTVKVTFDIPINPFTQEPNYEKLQYKVKYFDSTGKKFVLRPENAIEIQFTYNFNKVRMLSRFNSLGSGNLFNMSTDIFLKLEMDGKLKMFSFYQTQSSPAMYNAATGTMTGGFSTQSERFVLQLGEGELYRPRSIVFKKDMAEYLSDCPTLVEKIQNKDYRKSDLMEIVRYYNSNCK